MNRQTVIIIGGGLGGLFTGALLAKEGYAVTVLEKNAVIGGGLQTFTRGGVSFETGMHILGGLRLGGSIYKICRYLGILDSIRLRDVDHDCIDSITYLSDGHTYRIPEGREAFTAYFISEFPSEARGIRDYVEALYRLADEVDFFYLRSGGDELFSHSEQFLWAASDLIAHYVHDPHLRDVLAYMNPMYGGVAGHTPAYIHALINVLYIDGPSRFMGGSQQMADALAQVIADGGGRVVSGECVSAVHVSPERMATAVETASGHTYSADYYISAIHPSRLTDICDAGAFPKSYRMRVASIPNTYSAFTLYIKLKPETFRYINHTCYYQDDYGLVWQHGEYDAETWPRGFMYMTPSDDPQGDYASKMIINCLMPFSAVAQLWGVVVQPMRHGSSNMQSVCSIVWNVCILASKLVWISCGPPVLLRFVISITSLRVHSMVCVKTARTSCCRSCPSGQRSRTCCSLGRMSTCMVSVGCR